MPELIDPSSHFSPYRSDGKLYGFVCVVTGATQPIGQAIVAELACKVAAGPSLSTADVTLSQPMERLASMPVPEPPAKTVPT